jgi:hypothetical protein
MATRNFTIDLTTLRFVQAADINIGLRKISLTENESYSGSISVYYNDALVTIDGYTLSLNNKNNNITYSEASITSPNYSIVVAGTTLRQDICSKVSTPALLSLHITYNGEGYPIIPLPVTVIGSPSTGESGGGDFNGIVLTIGG